MKINKYIYGLAGVLLVLLGFAACTPDEYDLGDKDVTSADLVEGKAFSITHDSNNPNIVYLKSLMADQYQVNWIEPQGRSQEKEVELDMPFPGTYDVLFGVETRGGVVYGDTAHFTIDNFYAGFVNDELYTNLTGGVGQAKTWIPDNGNYGLCSGELSYGDPSASNAEWNNFTSNWDPSYGGGGMAESATSQYAKTTWTFDLKNGANVTLHRVDDDGTATDTKGTFLLDTENHRLNLTDMQIPHTSAWDNHGDATDWSKDIHIVTLTENQLRVAMLRNPNTSGEGKWWLVFNFVAKDYADNYKAPEVEYTPTLEEGWRDFVEPKNDRIITYKLTGFDWYGKDENTTEKNVSGVEAIDNLEDISITLNSSKHTYSFTKPDGTTSDGTYSLSSDGVYTFTPALPTVQLSKDGRAVLTGNEGQLRLLGFSQAVNCDAQTGALDNITWGAREYDDQGNFYQYIGYQWKVVRAGAKTTFASSLHFFDTGWTAQASDEVFITDGQDGTYTITLNGASNNPYGLYLDVAKILKDHPNCDIVVTDIKVDGQSIAFNDADIDRGYGDTYKPADACARRYILNPWGATAGDAPKFVFSKSIAVTIQVKMDTGAPLVKPSAKRHARRR